MNMNRSTRLARKREAEREIIRKWKRKWIEMKREVKS